ncbi:hypothetical protein P8H26_09350 [Pseudochrobactrum sp. sp1633]|uniref:hypothetical protein n=1 Tax=Pseudochrobactrum sp. sp1633 TaxID=3036706 RepID=UPI0025A4E8BA|nr:hypothetical protein [Pseudochrobactrum sp. sp1633]MDM8345597.1 hypothetical protein [Pseudochrobactrum sp. sp1633]HWD13243.1 hypothetical protein [Pseudochrobactrum sp.]
MSVHFSKTALPFAPAFIATAMHDKMRLKYSTSRKSAKAKDQRSKWMKSAVYIMRIHTQHSECLKFEAQHGKSSGLSFVSDLKVFFF